MTQNKLKYFRFDDFLLKIETRSGKQTVFYYNASKHKIKNLNVKTQKLTSLKYAI